jgi:hypothetical protein
MWIIGGHINLILTAGTQSTEHNTAQKNEDIYPCPELDSNLRFETINTKLSFRVISRFEMIYKYAGSEQALLPSPGTDLMNGTNSSIYIFCV